MALAAEPKEELGRVEEKDEADTPPLTMTYEEFLDWLDENKHAEWVNGKVVMHSPVSRVHNTVGKLLIGALDGLVQARDLGEVFYEPFQMKIGPDFPGRAPDIMFVAHENLDRLEQNRLIGPADLIIEIVSPESVARDRGEKFAEYERGGVREYWIVDPLRRLAEFYRLGEDGFYRPSLPDAEGIYRSEVMPGLWLRVAWLWQSPLPSTLTILREWGF